MYQPIEIAARIASTSRRAFDQLVATSSRQPAFRHGARASGPARPIRWLPPAIERGGSDLTDEVDAAMSIPSSSDAVRHEHAQLAVLETLFGDEARPARKAAVMRRDEILAEPLRPT
jgi:hypothetical protein